MKQILFVVMAMLFLSSCEKNAWSNYQMDEYQGEFTFTEISKKAEWKKRFDMATTVYDNKLWVIGGYNPGLIGEDTYLEDVWYTTDGNEWEQATGNAPWKGRRGHKVVSFNAGDGEAMYLIGGFSSDEQSGFREYCNDVWKSTDGINWQELKPNSTPYFSDSTNWYPRFNHQVVVANLNGNSQLFLIGGASLITGQSASRAMKYFNDVWTSNDGVNWEKVNNTDFGKRSELAAVYNADNGEIYIQGGHFGFNYDSDTTTSHPVANVNWVWKSTDGENWAVDSINQEFYTGYFSRSKHHLVYYNGYLWGFPGKSPYHVLFAETSRRAIWKRVGESNYVVDSQYPVFYGRYGYGLEIWNDKIWVLGGYTATSGQSNDVWTLEIE